MRVMDRVKLPDLDRLRGVKDRMKELPPQESATDTSNWENRNISGSVMDTDSGEYAVRNLDFMKDKELDFIPLTKHQNSNKKSLK